MTLKSLHLLVPEQKYTKLSNVYITLVPGSIHSKPVVCLFSKILIEYELWAWALVYVLVAQWKTHIIEYNKAGMGIECSGVCVVAGGSVCKW